MHQLPETGYLRLRQIIGESKAESPVPAVIPVSKSTWWAGVKSGRYPQPVRTLGARITAWRCEDIRALIERLNTTVAEAAGTPPLATVKAVPASTMREVLAPPAPVEAQ